MVAFEVCVPYPNGSAPKPNEPYMKQSVMASRFKVSEGVLYFYGQGDEVVAAFKEWAHFCPKA